MIKITGEELPGPQDGRQAAIVVAHPDDETFLAAQLMRYPDALVIHVTDGAPEHRKEWKGFPTRKAYAQAREKELKHALDAAGHRGVRIMLGFQDSTLKTRLLDIGTRLREHFWMHRTHYVYTHAYEGGHPDHDAVAAAVHQTACGLDENIIIYESPFYHKEGEKSIYQEFIPHDGFKVMTVNFTDEEQLAKSKMMASHRSQRLALAKVSRVSEKYRLAPAYDFSRPPNQGALSRNYERVGGWAPLVLEA